MAGSELVSIIVAVMIIAPVIGSSEYVWSEPYKCSCRLEGIRWSDPFFKILNKIQCCNGFAYCNRSAVETNERYRNLLLCFSDTSCIYNPEIEQSDLDKCNDSLKCSKDAMVAYNVSNVMKEWSIYKCISVQGVDYALCLLPICNSFAAVEKNCLCNGNDNNCICYSGILNENIIFEDAIKTYALFLSFADNYTIVKNTIFPTVTVIVVLFSAIALVVVLILLFKGIRFLKRISSSEQNGVSLQEIFMRFCHLRSRGFESNSSAIPQTVGAPKEGRPNNGRGDDHVLPTYDEAVRNERAIHAIELPPTYADTTS